MREKKASDITFTESVPAVTLSTGFVTLTRLLAQNVYDDGSRSKPYPCDIITRPKLDAVAVLPYIFRDGITNIVLRSSIRPVVRYREKEIDDAGQFASIDFIEIPAGLLEEKDGNGEEGIRRCAARELLEEPGYAADARSIETLGSGYYSSPGLFTERVYLTAVDITDVQAGTIEGDGSPMEEAGSLVTVPLAEALTWCMSGKIANGATEIALRRFAARRMSVPDGERITAVLQNRFARISEELGRMKREHEGYNRLIREFQANVTHELKHPIANIMGYVNLIKKGNLPDDIREKAFSVISENIAKMSKVSENLIATALSGDAIENSNTVFSPADEIASVIAEASFLYDPSTVGISVTIEPGVTQLIGVRERFHLIADGIITNALKFTREGKVAVFVREVTSMDGTIDFSPDLFNYHSMKDIRPFEIELAVADTGIGVPKAKIKSIFKPFYQIDSGFDREYGGMGLGLFVVENIVDAMQGTIDIESDTGRGTTVRVRLPLGKVTE